MTMAREHIHIDRAKLHNIAKNYLDLKRLRPDAEKATRPSLLTDVERFEKASLAGEYYESFGVNSQNYTQKSAGTSAWLPRTFGSWIAV